MRAGGDATELSSASGTCTDVTYSYRPSLLGAPVELRLATDALEWRKGSRSGRTPYGDIRRVRLSFRPLTLQTNRFIAEVWARGQPKLEIVSTSWRSMVEQEPQDEKYVGFLRELHRRIAESRATVSFETGSPAFIYWPGLVVFVAVSLGLSFLVVRALEIAAWAAAVFVGGFLAVFLWQAGSFFQRNRPRRYRPEALPMEVLPRT
ncbi:MAG TPA: hypothetical protein VHA77_16305 [Xanthobacteraceae bacterium]|jgi:hypothetical protein|nr:hypothetical protein [Xanthobacteraceae bacterium]